MSLSELQRILLLVPSSQHMRNWSSYYSTTGSHFIGQGRHHAEWTRAKWKAFGIPDVRIVTYDTRIPMPTGQQRLALLRDGRVLYEAPLVDDAAAADENSTAGSSSAETGFMPAYYGFSAKGDITASYVFCNFGTDEDYDDLERLNITLTGKIAVVKSTNASPYLQSRRMEIFRGVQVANAEARGAVGVVLYVDPQNDGPVTEAKGFKPFPDGPARQLRGIERGTLGNLEDFEAGLLPKIPSMPISTIDAIHLLRGLNKHGVLAHDLNDRWHGGALDFYGVDYNIGPSPPDLLLHLVNHAILRNGSVNNVIATIPGAIADDEVVIIGNHRDAWGPGAGDPNSGSAALNEVVRSFGVALQIGWRPYRTVVFASWEGEELGQIGSLSWIREHLGWLRASAVAYLNVVVAAAGMVFRAKGSPLLYNAVYSATNLVLSPNQTRANQSVRDVWGGEIGTAGGGDAIRFQGLPCIATLDFGFAPGLGMDHGVFPYHTGFDNFDWMNRIGDPGWEYHVATAKIWSVMTAQLAQSQVLDMSVTDYAVAIQHWVNDIDQVWSSKINLSALHDAIQRLGRAARAFDAHAESIKASTNTNWWKIWSSDHQRDAAIREANKVYIAFERQFFHKPGLDNNPSLHHVIYGPSAWHNEAPPMPGLRQNLVAANWTNAETWRNIIIHKLDDATHLLDGQRDFTWEEMR
ncbi:hypothetical protein GGR57DRAFT_495677 [Xylariaceae sp. FL1272]|nr:hypothetical protein GGR57DRAFT_495677 [Xylariaceae sp. FL1272]